MPGCFPFLRKKSSRANSETPSSQSAANHHHAGSTGIEKQHSGCACSFPEVDPTRWTLAGNEALPKYDALYAGSDGLHTIAKAVDDLSPSLRECSISMHENPELGWVEFKTTKLLSEFIESHGFKVTRNAYGTETGFEAVFQHGQGGRTIGFNSEMDALPGFSGGNGCAQACGHNLIAIAGLGGAIATAQAMKAHNVPGRVILLGTPAEEKDGGKIVMIKNGGYKSMDVCLMAHPTPYTGLIPMLAVSECVAEFFGHKAHAAGAPWEGVNALDAAVLAYSSISALRQQTHPDSRIHGIIMGSEEWVCNIIPGHSKIQFGVRNPKQAEVEILKKKIDNCIKAAGQATGCRVEIKWIMQYLDMQNNSTLGSEYKRYMESELKIEIPQSTSAFGSTDFGDVTYELPGLHPMFAIPVGPGEGNHTEGFAKAARTKEAHQNTIQVAKGLAAVGWRILTDENFAKAAKKEYEEVRKPQKP